MREQGHEVRLIPAQYVKPYVKTNKSDYIDAEAIAEAVGRPTMRFVPVKSDDQLDLQSLHRVRERWVMRRTAVVNQIRGLLLECGTTLRKGRRYVDEALPGILAGGLSSLSGAVLVLLAELKQELEQLAEKIDRADRSVEKEPLGKMKPVESGEYAGSGSCDGNRDHRDDWLRYGIPQGARFRGLVWGVVPEEHSTRGRQTLWKIPKRGKPVPAQVVRARGPSCNAAPDQAVVRVQVPGWRNSQREPIKTSPSLLWQTNWHEWLGAVLVKNEAYRPPLLAGTTSAEACR